MLEDPVETRLYLTAPPLKTPDDTALAAMLALGAACLTVDISGFVEADATALERMIAAADAADCPLLATGDDALALDLAGRFALDGVHLGGSPKQVAWARKRIGTDAIVGYGAGTSREDGLAAAEAGADYVMLSPASDVEQDLVVWWQAVIETPLVIGGIAAAADIDALRGIADFVAVDPDYTGGTALDFVRDAASRLTA